MLTKKFIQENLLTQTGKLSSQKLRNHNVTLTNEQLYLIWHNLTAAPICLICCNIAKFKSFSQGYRTFCSSKCAANAISTITKRKKTNIKKYGVEHPTQLATIQKK